jgi:hypothetical protein
MLRRASARVRDRILASTGQARWQTTRRQTDRIMTGTVAVKRDHVAVQLPPCPNGIRIAMVPESQETLEIVRAESSDPSVDCLRDNLGGMPDRTSRYSRTGRGSAIGTLHNSEWATSTPRPIEKRDQSLGAFPISDSRDARGGRPACLPISERAGRRRLHLLPPYAVRSADQSLVPLGGLPGSNGDHGPCVFLGLAGSLRPFSPAGGETVSPGIVFTGSKGVARLAWLGLAKDEPARDSGTRPPRLESTGPCA